MTKDSTKEKAYNGICTLNLENVKITNLNAERIVKGGDKNE